MENNPIIFFDGECNFCNKSVQFVIRRDKKNKFLFSSLQENYAKETLKSFQITNKDLNTSYLYHNQTLYTKSSCALHIAKQLSGLWPLLYVFIIIPKPIRDKVYSYIAKNRYRWLGKKDNCIVPSQEMKVRFITNTQKQ